MIQVVPLAELVEDMTIYPRHAVDGVHVASLVMAIKAGATLPPLVAEESTKRIVDGWHRARALRRVVGETGTAEVDLRRYSNEADLILDAIALNSTHGRRLDRMDQVRAILLAEHAGASLERVAIVLQMPAERARKLRVRVAHVSDASAGEGGVILDPPRIVLKRPMAHLADTELTDEQARAAGSMPGTSLLLTSHQLRDALKFDLVNRSDERLLEALKELRDELYRYLGPPGRRKRSA